MRLGGGTTRRILAALAVVLASLAASAGGDQTWEQQLAERRKWWSLQPVVRPELPIVRDAGWSDHPIDRFILAKLESQNLHPAPRADRATLIRRLSFALTGLPPAPADVAAFLADETPDAYDKLADRLLASPHFGERSARHWMDVVRYGDTYGYEWDIAAKGAWRYRDYLIRAFNADVPFDQLVREQIAGDLLEHPRTDPSGGINESIIGTMFFHLGENRHGDSLIFNGVHQEMVNNKIDAFSKAFQATTIACARCHDHKLDAVAQNDYFALAGVFMSSRWVTNTADLPARHAAGLAELRGIKQKLRKVLGERWRDAARDIDRNLVAAQTSMKSNAGTCESFGELDAERVHAWRAALTALKAPTEDDPLFPWLRVAGSGTDVRKEWDAVATRYAELRRERSKRNAREFQVLADFRNGMPTGWTVDGVGLRDGVAARGDFTVALEGPCVVGLVLPGGVYTNALSPRMNGALRSPLLNTFTKPHVSFESAGGFLSVHRTVYDNGFLGEHVEYLKGSTPQWVRLTTAPEQANRRAYIEFVTKANNPYFPPRFGLGPALTEEQLADTRSWFGVSRVLLHDTPSTPDDELSRFEGLFKGGEAPTSLEQVAQRYRAWLGATVDAWSHDQAGEDDVRLISWMLESGLLPNRWDDAGCDDLRRLVLAYREAEKRLPDPQTMNGMADVDAGYDYRVELRGEYANLGPPAPRTYPASLGGSGKPFTTSRSGRRELAETVASPRNPLTARVFVNRVWHWLFGTGVVATPDDFGRLGELPSHPELLDHLAARFASRDADGLGWSPKRLIRLIVLSETFRQSGETSESARTIDPQNRLLHHFPLRRLEAEAVRDAVLAVSGRLDPSLYGAPVNPPRAKEDPTKRLFSGPLDGNGRRSIYVLSSVMEPTKLLATFNQPNPKIPTGRRDVTNVPAQALALLNDPFVHGQAEFWAKRTVAAASAAAHESAPARLTQMFRTAYAREPSADELVRWGGLIDDLAALHGVKGDDVMSAVAIWKDVAHAMFNTKEFIYIR